MTGAKIFACDGAGDQVFFRVSPQGDAAIKIGDDDNFLFVSVRREELDLAVIGYLVCVDGAWERIMGDELMQKEFGKREGSMDEPSVDKHVRKTA